MEHYSVVVSGFKRGEEFFRGRMMKQGMKVAQIERVIQAVPCILKQGLSFDEAKRFEDVFREAGAIVEVRKDGEPEPDEFVTNQRGARPSQPRLTPLVQPLPAPPEEPPPAPAPPLLDLESAAAPAAPAAEAGMLDLLDAPPAVPPEPEPAPAPAPVAAPVAAAFEAKPPAVFTAHNPWIFRGVWIGLAFLLSLITVSCVSKYKVGERLHDFSAAVDDDMANDLIGLARARGGQVGAADLEKLVDTYARRTHVKVEMSNLRVGFAYIQQGPGGVCSGMLPPSVGDIPPDKRMQWMMRVRNCSAYPWIIGFDVAITARVGLSKDTLHTQQWIFVADWTGAEP